MKSNQSNPLKHEVAGCVHFFLRKNLLLIHNLKDVSVVARKKFLASAPVVQCNTVNFQQDDVPRTQVMKCRIDLILLYLTPLYYFVQSVIKWYSKSRHPNFVSR